MSENKSPTESHVAAVGPLAPGQRWSLARKREVALRLLRGEPLDAALRRIGELSMENELLHAKIERPGPLVGRRSKR